VSKTKEDLPGAGDAGDDSQAIVRDREGDVLEIMDSPATDKDGSRPLKLFSQRRGNWKYRDFAVEECPRKGENEDVLSSPRSTGGFRVPRFVLGFYRNEAHGEEGASRDPQEWVSGARL